MQECTFHPKISKSPREAQGKSKNKENEGRSINTVFERQVQWKKERDLSKAEIQ
jgi:hypothetical protein